jgi:hypothetical protein
MKTIDLTQQKVHIKDLLRLADSESLLILSDDGHQYILEEADAFEKEVALLGGSDKFMKFLEERAKEKSAISIDGLEKKLKIKTRRPSRKYDEKKK